MVLPSCADEFDKEIDKLRLKLCQAQVNLRLVEVEAELGRKQCESFCQVM